MKLGARFVGVTLAVAGGGLGAARVWQLAGDIPWWLDVACAVAGALVLLGELNRERDRLSQAAAELQLAQEETRQTKVDCLREVAQVQQDCKAEMDHFHSGLSHGLRMPLSIVQGYAALLAGGLVEEESVRQEYLAKILQRTRDMADAMARQGTEDGGADPKRPNYSRFDLIQLARQVVADTKTAAETQGIQIQVVSLEAECLIRADASQLNRALFNLIENGVKYMGREGIITIRIIRQGQETVSVVVKDDGMGLGREETSHIFELNFQGSNHTAGGQGHGLALVQDIVKNHGGTICAESDFGMGMGIFVTIPVTPPQKIDDLR